jgi:hypothetical protein
MVEKGIRIRGLDEVRPDLRFIAKKHRDMFKE